MFLTSMTATCLPKSPKLYQLTANHQIKE